MYVKNSVADDAIQAEIREETLAKQRQELALKQVLCRMYVILLVDIHFPYIRETFTSTTTLKNKSDPR